MNVGPQDRKISPNTDEYWTYVWQVYDPAKSAAYKSNNRALFDSGNGNFDAVMDEYYEAGTTMDKVLVFVNSQLLYYGYFAHADLLSGIEYWGSSTAKFYVGTSNFHADRNIYYQKGYCYATRLYTRTLTTDEVSANYDMTLRYRSSF